MEFWKRNLKYIIIFSSVLVLFTLFFYENCNFDVIWNYGFSHSIRIGEVPYRDFNLISTPLYSFIMSILLFIKDDIFVFLIEQAILVTILFYMLYRQFGNRAYLVLFFLAFPLFEQLIATYNFFAYFLIVLLFLLEKEKKSNKIIGLVLGLLIITKQTIGIPILIISFLGIRKFNIIKERLIYALIPCIFLFGYLIVTKSLKQFIDLCFLGLFDFSGNGVISIKVLFITTMLLLFLIINIIRDKNNILKYYALGSFTFIVPLFDYYHIMLFLGVVILVYVDKLKLSEGYSRNIAVVLFLIMIVGNLIIVPNRFSNLAFLGEEHFKYYVVNKKDKNKIKNIIEKYSSEDNIYMLDNLAMFYDLASLKKITYFDVLLKGNYGYNGTTKMIKKVKNMKKCKFLIDRNKYKYISKSDQLDTKIIKYVVDNYKRIGSIENYDIYKID